MHPDWNFYKYLVDHNGKVLKVWSTKTTVEEIFDRYFFFNLSWKSKLKLLNSIKAAVEAIPQPSVDTVKAIETDESAQKDEL